MHPNSTFRQISDQDALKQAGLKGFGQVSINGEFGPVISHIPFILSSDRLVEAHLVRSNPIFKQLADGPLPAVLSVELADAYISPDWFEKEDQVPTWNYIAIHLRGHFRRLEAQELERILDQTSARFEADLAPKTPWTMDKMQPKTKTAMMRAIAPVALDITDLQSTWKLSQNKSDPDRQGVIQALGDHPIAHWMQQV